MTAEVTAEALRRPPFAFAKRHGLIVGEVNDGHVTLFARPGVNVAAIAEARRFLRRSVKVSTISLDEFDKLLAKAAG